MTSSALVFIMIPALSLIYAGIGNRSFAMTLFRLPLITAAFIGLQWALWGYALTFTRSTLSTNWWGGESRAFGLFDVAARPIGIGDGVNGASIPELVYVIYEGMFASFTAAIVCGGTMQRARPARFLVFISIWSVLVYYPVARWSWDIEGWSKKLGVMDFAGGTPVHIVSGTTVATFAIFCSFERHDSVGDSFGHVKKAFLEVLRTNVILAFLARHSKSAPRHPVDESQSLPSDGYTQDGDAQLIVGPSIGEEQSDSEAEHPATGPPAPGPVANELLMNARPQPQLTTRAPEKSQVYSVNYVVLGTALLWFGWAGFNGGSALGGNLRSVSAWTSTHVAACSGGTMAVVLIWLDKTIARRTPGYKGDSFDSMSALYFCDGALAGLVAITPGAGYVPVWSAVIFGVVSYICVWMLRRPALTILKNDPLQIFLLHAGAGVVGMCLTGLFARYQLVDCIAGIGYTFVVTMAILCFMKLTVHCVAKRSVSPHSLKDNPLQATEMQEWVGVTVAGNAPAVQSSAV
ncbi:Rh-like protein/ammonium transporter [Cadophora sp. DSE1049]|nr:Rh-like protein/ammonium transporter [Cadophora sp. DSE1049]